MFVPNDNGYPTTVYHKSLGILGYKVVHSAVEHEDLLKSIEPKVTEPKPETKSYVKKPLKYTEG
jgi:hypothetical protein